MDPVDLLAELVRRPSVTPDDGGILALVGELLDRAGYTVERMDAEGTKNLYATKGPADLCLAGHVDTVPVGAGWTRDPHGAVIDNGLLYGRGACDMKGGVAALVSAALTAKDGVSILLTSDEEGPATHGTRHVLERLAAENRLPAEAIVCEPTSEAVFGDAFKIGRRGSLSGRIVVEGKAGHVAYPERADNAAHRLAPALAELVSTRWDEGDAHFSPTGMQIHLLESGSTTSNVIPGTARIGLNFRYGPASTAADLAARTEEIFRRHGATIATEWHGSCEPFLTAEGPLTERLRAAVSEIVGLVPRASTLGGTSDARFFAAFGVPVAELGTVPIAMHGADEAVRADDVKMLTKVLTRLAYPQ